jgi:hypothetical protein
LTKALPQLNVAMAALKFHDAQRDGLRKLDKAACEDLLATCNRTRLTILLRQNCGDELPEQVRSRIDQNIRDNRDRFERLKNSYLEIVRAFQEVGAEHLVLKGFTQSPEFAPDPSLRMQGDLDLFCPAESIVVARDVLFQLGYTVIHGREHQPTDHLPTMVRQQDWKYRGNPFDPEIPLAVEVHFRFWNDATTRLRIQGLDDLWTRRSVRRHSFAFPSLSTVDRLGYTALHVFHHVLGGGLTPYSVYELAYFLETNAENKAFWKQWGDLHHDSLRRIEAVSFLLATRWFACRISEQARGEVERVPAAVREWFRKYSDSMLDTLPNPNKAALWLHLSLLESVRDKRLVFYGNIFPIRIPAVSAVRQWRLRSYIKYIAHAVSRVCCNVCNAPKTLLQGFRWWQLTKRPSKLP